MNLPKKQVSRTKATIAGALAGMTVAICAAVVVLTVVSGSTPAFQKQGLTGSAFMILILPGSVLIGAIFAFPTSAAMVFSLTAIEQKLRWFDKVWIWMAAGTLFASPTAYLFSNLQNTREQFALLSIWSFGLVIGAISGLFSWLFRHRAAPE